MDSATLASEEVRLGDLESILKATTPEFENLRGKRVLVTGGAGFLGYYLVQTLLHWNDKDDGGVTVTLLDNFRRGVPPWLAGLEGRSDLELANHDITDQLPSDLSRPQFVIHAAGIASPGLYRQIPIETMDANVGGLRRLLDASVAWKAEGQPLEGFLFFSSSEIYGDPVPEAIPTPETYRGNVSCTGPRACYDESKRYGETLAVNFARVHQVPVTIARPFNNYGPGMKINDGRVIADFSRAVFAGEDIVMYSDGSPTRTFCYIADAISGYFKVLLAGRPGEPYNVGTDSPEISIFALAGLIAQAATNLFDYQGTVVRKTADEPDYLVDNPNRRCPDLSKSKGELRYEPRVEIEEGIRRTLLWYRGNPEAIGR